MSWRSRIPCARKAVRLLVAGLTAACRDPLSGSDPRACQQTYEFGNSGCFEVEGQVVGTAGQALPDISVGPRYLPGRTTFNTAYATTDAAGRFRLRLARMAVAAPGGPGPDTVSVYIQAADPRSAGLYVPARIRDSVLTVVTIAPVGTVPVPVVVRITLAVP